MVALTLLTTQNVLNQMPYLLPLPATLSTSPSETTTKKPTYLQSITTVFVYTITVNTDT